MDRSALIGKLRDPGLALYLALLALLLAVNVVAISGILAAREGARREALVELRLGTEIHARSLEAVLADLRSDLLFLGHSPPIAGDLPLAVRDDPMARRWRRLDVEGTMLLFLTAHPAVQSLTLTHDSGAVRVATGRRSGVPVVLPPDTPSPSIAGTDEGQESDPGLLVGRWPVGAGAAGDRPATLEATVLLDRLVRTAAPGLEGRLSLLRDGELEPPPQDASFATRVPVRDDGWDPPLSAVLVRSETGSRLVRSVEALAGRYRTTVALNVAVVGLTVTLGFLAFRQARRAERLAAEKAQEVRLRELERQLLHSERLASVGRLAAGMAHEINNPLEGMGNYLSLLDDELAAGDLAAARGQARRVRDGLERAAGILRRVLTMSSAGRESHQALDLRQAVSEAVGFVRSSGSFPGVVVRLELSEEPLPILGSPVALGQLFLNLLLNACQVQPAGGEVEVALSKAGEAARVIVADRGPGLAPEARLRLFEPFFSTRGSTGLGLAVCHAIAGDHQGEIEARDRPGGGTEIEVRLPLRTEVAHEVASKTMAAERPAR